jgi:branched-chain amino acid aminotransferase
MVLSAFSRLIISRGYVNATMHRAKLTGQYTTGILAKMEAKRAGYDEALLLDVDGYVAEGSGENVFMVRDRVLKTPPANSILGGITRDTVMQLAKDEGLAVIEQRLTRDELYTADEVFFSGTAAEITPIRELDNRTIGDGKPGPITRTLSEKYFDVVLGRNAKYKSWLTYI